MRQSRRLRVAVILFLSIFGSSCKKRVARSESSLAGSVERFDSAPPATLYHFGAYQNLRANENLDVLRSVWSNIVKAHVPFRQGLYVAQHPGYAERYALDQVLAPNFSDAPWVMEVQLRAECLEADRFSDGTIPTTWFASYTGSKSAIWSTAEEFAQNCSGTAFNPLFAGQGEQSRCGNTMAAYFSRPREDSPFPIGIARDRLWPDLGFWYIRDPDCIAAVRSSPADILRISGSIPEYWSQAPFSDGKVRDTGSVPHRLVGEATLAILIRALMEASDWVVPILQDIENNAVFSDIQWLQQAVIRIVDKAVSCKERQSEGELKTLMSLFLEKLARRDITGDSPGAMTYQQQLEILIRQSESACTPVIVQTDGTYYSFVQVKRSLAPMGARGEIRFSLPESAELRQQGNLLPKTGSKRMYRPPSDCRGTYHFSFEATAIIAGRPKELTKSLELGCSEIVEINTLPAFEAMQRSSSNPEF